MTCDSAAHYDNRGMPVVPSLRASLIAIITLAALSLNLTGVTNLLMKPFTADALARRLKELIAAKQQGAERG